MMSSDVGADSSASEAFPAKNPLFHRRPYRTGQKSILVNLHECWRHSRRSRFATTLNGRGGLLMMLMLPGMIGDDVKLPTVSDESIQHVILHAG